MAFYLAFSFEPSGCVGSAPVSTSDPRRAEPVINKRETHDTNTQPSKIYLRNSKVGITRDGSTMDPTHAGEARHRVLRYDALANVRVESSPGPLMSVPVLPSRVLCGR